VRDFHLKDFFDVWGQPFDKTHILGFHTTGTNSVTMTVNGKANSLFGNLVLKDLDQIVITATNAQPPGAFFAVGGNGHVEVRRDADGVIVADFMPFGSTYTEGISVAVGDVNKDGSKDLVVSTTSGSAQVKVYNGAAISGGTFNPDNPEASRLA